MTSAQDPPDANVPEPADPPSASPTGADGTDGTTGTDGAPATSVPSATPSSARSRSEAHGHKHRDVSGGWLRPAVFGAMDGLVTNVSLIAGVGGGGARSQVLILTGLAGLAAGALSMATGEFVSVSSQNELVASEVSKERYELEHYPEAEQRELAAVFRSQGVDAETADRVARQVSVRPEQALRLHVREELGVDHHDLPSPLVAAGASLVTFAVGALIPLLPYLLGLGSLPATLVLAGFAAFVGGGIVSRITAQPFLRGAVRQLLLATVAAGLTYGIGVAVHAAYGAAIH